MKKNTLIHAMTDTFFMWHNNLKFNWHYHLKDLHDFYKDAGYYYPNFTDDGLLSIEIEFESFKSVLSRKFNTNDDTESGYAILRSAIMTAAMGFSDLLPQMLNVLNEERADYTAKVYIYKAFIINDNDMDQWYSYIEKDFDNDEMFIRLAIIGLLENKNNENIKKAWELSKRLTDDSHKIKLLPYLSLFQEFNLDTSDWADFIIEDQEEYYYDGYKIEWLKKIGDRDIINNLFDNYSNNTQLLQKIFLDVIATPDEWKEIHPKLLQKKEKWLKDEPLENENTNLVISYVTLLGIIGSDLSSDIESTSWCQRAGAYLGSIGKLTTEFIDKQIEKEDDSDALFALNFIRVFSVKSIDIFSNVSITKEYNTISYDINRVCQSLIINKEQESFFPDIMMDYYLYNIYNFDPIKLNISSDYGIKKFNSCYKSVIDVNTYSLNEFNFFKIAYSNLMENYKIFWEEKFLLEKDFTKSSELLYILSYHNLKTESTEITAKSDMHRLREKIFSPREFDSLYPLFFDIELDDLYKTKLVNSSKAVLHAKPRQALSLFRFCNFNAVEHEIILNSLNDIPGSPLATQIISILTNRFSQYDCKEIEYTLGLDKNFVPGLINYLKQNSSLSKEEKAELLLKCEEYSGNDDEKKIVMRELFNIYPGQKSLIDKYLKSEDWSMRQDFLPFLYECDSSGDFKYLEEIVDILRNDNDCDVKDTAHNILEKYIIQLNALSPDKTIKDKTVESILARCEFEYARKFHMDDNLTEAQEYYETIVRKYKNSTDDNTIYQKLRTLLNLSNIYENNGDVDQSATIRNEITSKYNNTTDINIKLLICKVLYNSEKYDILYDSYKNEEDKRIKNIIIEALTIQEKGNILFTGDKSEILDAALKDNWSTLIGPWKTLAEDIKKLDEADQQETFSFSFMREGNYSDKEKTLSFNTENISEDDFINQVALAFQEWKELFESTFSTQNGYKHNLTLNFINLGLEDNTDIPCNEDSSDYPIGRKKGEIGDFRFSIHKIDGSSETLAHSWEPDGYPGRTGNYGGDIHFDSDENWIADGNSDEGISILWVTAHELGHSFGVGHNKHEESLMHPTINEYSYEELFPNGLKNSRHEKVALEGIYGTKK